VNVGCVLLAAGSGRRFGGNKLLHEVDGVPMIEHALSLFGGQPFCTRVCVTKAEAGDFHARAEAHGFTPVVNPDAERGMGTSAAIGTAAAERLCPNLDGILFAVCDQPYLTGQSVERMLKAFIRLPNDILALSFCGMRGNPVIFPREFFPELRALDRDVGGGAVIRKHPDRLVLVECEHENELRDIDTRA
jgi:molybdenum cofactor cytidylyltransferase